MNNTTRLPGLSKARVILPLTMLLLVSLWFVNKLSFPFNSAPDKSKKYLDSLLPAGTQLELAVDELTKVGCACAEAKSSTFVDEGGLGAPTRYNNIKYVECTIQRSALLGIPEYLWIIALPYDEQRRLTNIFVRVSNRSLIVP